MIEEKRKVALWRYMGAERESAQQDQLCIYVAWKKFLHKGGVAKVHKG